MQNFISELGRRLGPGVFEFTVDENGDYEVTFEAPPYDGPQNRNGRRAYARMMRKRGYSQVEVHRVVAEGGAA